MGLDHLSFSDWQFVLDLHLELYVQSVIIQGF